MGTGDGSRYAALARLILQFKESIYAFKQLLANLLARAVNCVERHLPRLPIFGQHLSVLDGGNLVAGDQPHPIDQYQSFHNL